jgi:hypothetical protein
MNYNIYIDLFTKYKKNTFIETGSHRGESINRALRIGYKKIMSVEPFDEDYNFCVERFKNNPEVELFHGYSEDLFAKMMQKVDEPATIFLDAHKNAWFDGGTHPLSREIEVLKAHPIKTHTIIVDDYEHGAQGMTCVSNVIIEIDKINNEYRFEAIRRINGILVAYVN